MVDKQTSTMIVSLDVGTSKVSAIVAERNEDGSVEVVGIGSAVASGMKRGVVVNIEATTEAIAKAIREAELLAGCHVHSVYTGIAGNHVRSLNSHGIVAIRDQDVGQGDVDRVIDAARAVAIPADQKILHVLPQEFIIDNQGGIKDPIGMSGVRLEAKVHLVTCAVNAAQNIEKCINQCELEVEEVILEQLASSYAVLTDDERELGVCLIDIGAGTTDIAVFTDGAIRHTANIPIAGDQVTNDIAMAFRTPTQHAEDIKIKHACAMGRLASSGETIKVSSVGDRPPRDLSRRNLAEVVEPRYEELFLFVQAELRRSGFEDLIAAGIVLTGGTSKMHGAVELAEEVFNVPVRLGKPQGIVSLQDIAQNPIYATGVGLLHYGFKQEQEAREVDADAASKSILDKIKHWLSSNF